MIGYRFHDEKSEKKKTTMSILQALAKPLCDATRSQFDVMMRRALRRGRFYIHALLFLIPK